MRSQYVILEKLKCVKWEFAQGNELEGYFRLLYLRIRRTTATPRTVVLRTCGWLWVPVIEIKADLHTLTVLDQYLE